MSSAPISAPAPSDSIEIGTGTRVFYGIGGAATGVVSSGISTFVLLYYNLALGVPAGLVSAALAIALIFDAVSDPVVGFWSDKVRSRWGRRHPFMYFAILPVAILVYALWNPPHETLGPQELFLYLVAVVIPLRLMLTFFDVPSNALIPELTEDYDERTRLSLYRVSANWAAVTLLAVTLYGYWLRPTDDFPNGLLNPAGYGAMGLASAIAVLLCMLICSGGLHHLIPRLRPPPADHVWSIRGTMRGVWTTVSEPALRPLMVASVLISSSFSAYGALIVYVYSYFWLLSTAQISGLTFMWGVGITAGFLLLPRISRGRNKRGVALVILLLLGLTETSLILLRLANWFPSSESALYYPLLLGQVGADMGIFIVLFSLLYSMFADVVEKRELASGQREEGTIYSVQTLIGKFSSAGGVWLAGMVLSVLDFPTGVDPSEASAEAIRNLGVALVIVIFTIYPIAGFALSRFQIDREGHGEHLEELRGRAVRGD